MPGGLYEISDKDQRRLDSLEDFPRSSNRLNVTVFDEDGQAVPAITYIKTGQLEETKPSAEYLSIIKQGYRDWGIT